MSKKGASPLYALVQAYTRNGMFVQNARKDQCLIKPLSPFGKPAWI
jgi:hypothetical protein